MMEEKENISDELDLCVASEATKLKTSKKLPKKKRCVQKRGKNICTFISVPPFLPTALLCLHFFDGSRKRQTNISFPFLFLLSTHTGLEWGGEGGKEEKEKASVILFLPHLSNGRSRPKKWKVAIYFSKKNLWLCKFSLYSFPFSWNFQENFICTVDSHANPKKLLPLRSANILISNRHLFLLLLLPSVFPSKSPQAKQKGEERERGQKRATLGTRFSLPARRKKTFLWGEEALSLEQRRLQTTTTKIRCIFRRLYFSFSSREKTHSSSQGLRERRKRRGWVLQGAFTAFPPL